MKSNDSHSTRAKVRLFIFRILQFGKASIWLVRNFRRFKKTLEKKYGAHSISPFRFSSWHQGAYYFKARHNNRQIFIKTDYHFRLLRNEIIAHQLLSQAENASDMLLSLAFYDQEAGEFIAYEFLDSVSLSDAIERTPRLDFIVDTLEKIAKILALFHTLGLVHRDLKEDNFLVTPQGRVVVIDFVFANSENESYMFCELDLDIAYNLRVLQYMGIDAQTSPYTWDDAAAMAAMTQRIAENSGVDLSLLKQHFLERTGRVTYSTKLNTEHSDYKLPCT